MKITAEDGHVTLQGTVRTEEDRQLIESRAIEVAGALHVSNEMTIAKSR
ncbi:MAG: BON domain-containing protein [Vicinamibacterales bacterium]